MGVPPPPFRRIGNFRFFPRLFFGHFSETFKCMNLMQRQFGPESQRRDEVKFLGEIKITTS